MGDSKRRNKKMKPVVCVQTGTWYDSAAQAAREIGVHGNMVSLAARTGRSCRGLNYRYDPAPEGWVQSVDSKSCPVADKRFGRAYPSIKDAASELGLPAKQLASMFRRSGKGTVNLGSHVLTRITWSQFNKMVSCGWEVR